MGGYVGIPYEIVRSERYDGLRPGQKLLLAELYYAASWGEGVVDRAGVSVHLRRGQACRGMRWFSKKTGLSAAAVNEAIEKFASYGWVITEDTSARSLPRKVPMRITIVNFMGTTVGPVTLNAPRQTQGHTVIKKTETDIETTTSPAAEESNSASLVAASVSKAPLPGPRTPSPAQELVFHWAALYEQKSGTKYVPTMPDFAQAKRLLSGGLAMDDLKRRMFLALHDDWWCNGEQTVKRFVASYTRWTPEKPKHVFT